MANLILPSGVSGKRKSLRIYGPSGELIRGLGKREGPSTLWLPSGFAADRAKRRLLDAHGNPIYDLRRYLAERKRLVVPAFLVVAGEKTAFSAMERHYLAELLKTRRGVDSESVRAVMQLVRAKAIHFDAARAMQERRSEHIAQGQGTDYLKGRFKPLSLVPSEEKTDVFRGPGGRKTRPVAAGESPYLEALREELLRRSVKSKIWLPRFGLVDLFEVARPD